MGRAWELSVDKQGIGYLIFDLKDDKQNTFSAAVIEELDNVLNAAATEKDIKVLVVKSGKPDSFAAGADISEFRKFSSASEAREMVRKGRQTFEKLANMPFPTIACIDGVCLGGGCEIALACTYRMATDSDKTKIGLPEVQLGILPGWGGTLRLPKLIGLVPAITLITSGKTVNGIKAFKMGLVDAMSARAFIDEEVEKFALSMLASKGRKKVLARRKRSWGQWAMEKISPLRSYVLSKARETVMKKTKGVYPAPLKILDVIQETFPLSYSRGTQAEEDGIVELTQTPEASSLIQLFFTNEAMKKNPGLRPEELKLPAGDFKQAAVVGAGIMGAGITWLFAKKGCEVRLKDIAYESLAKGMARVSSYNDFALKRRKMKRGQHNIFMHRISGTLSYDGFEKADIVVEAIDERRDLKLRVLPDVERAMREDAILCTNTSSLQVTDLATCLQRPERFVGLHFFNPVPRMPLVEVVRGEKTDPAVLAAVVKYVQKLGKTAVVVGDCAGFLVNRILIGGLLEGARLLAEGVPLQQIDRLYAEFGLPMGPLRLTDEVGIDIGYKASKSLEAAYGERMQVPEVFDQLMEKKLLGRKGGKGFYIYKGKNEEPNPEVTKLIKSAGEARLSDEEIVDRGVLLMINEAARCLEEEVVADARMLDMASIMGFGFPPYRGGLLRYADERGISQVVAQLRVLEGKYGARFAPVQLLIDMDTQGRKFYDTTNDTGDQGDRQGASGRRAAGGYVEDEQGEGGSAGDRRVSSPEGVHPA